MMEEDNQKRIGFKDLLKWVSQLDHDYNKKAELVKLYEEDCKIGKIINKNLEMQISSQKVKVIQKLVDAYEKFKKYQKAIYF